MIGTDICEIKRFEKLISDDKFLSKVFTVRETEYFEKRKYNTETVAASFAGKEAFFKAIGTGIGTFSLKDIEILRDMSGKPYIALNDNLESYCTNQGITDFDLSLSHDGGVAIAVVYLKVDNDKSLFEKCINKAKTDKKGILSYDVISGINLRRNTDSHKGTYGKVLVVGGSVGLTGAPIMSSQAMLKSGSGLITLMCAKSLNTIFECSLKEVMTLPLSDNDGIIDRENKYLILERVSSSDSTLLGPGMGRGRDVSSIMRYIVKNADKPLVIDADGINALCSNLDALKRHKNDIIMTPHMMEFSRLINVDIDKIKAEPKKYALEFAKEYNVVLVLKSHRTMVVFPDGEIYENILGNPGMATGGTGDVLSGIINSFTGQFKDVKKAALLGVFVHSLAADIAKEKTGEYSLTPTDIIENISSVLKYL